MYYAIAAAEKITATTSKLIKITFIMIIDGIWLPRKSCYYLLLSQEGFHIVIYYYISNMIYGIYAYLDYL